ncbi:hypothetical protein ACFOY4_04060 [Actinomadura syzygii]|uniref:hypothetical protein n=1 Tax=Actinomadura syzygii TaxID=1427538 RepID=UPI001CA3135E|nr:hypothetical protein [Actinomadura syzygii]
MSPVHDLGQRRLIEFLHQDGRTDEKGRNPGPFSPPQCDPGEHDDRQEGDEPGLPDVAQPSDQLDRIGPLRVVVVLHHLENRSVYGALDALHQLAEGQAARRQHEHPGSVEHHERAHRAERPG